jgi:hypothetical protein
VREDVLKQVKMAHRLYYLATKHENEIPPGVIIFAKKICNQYTKLAKEMKLRLNDEEIFDEILK